MEMLEVGQTYGPENVNSICKPIEGEKALVMGNEGEGLKGLGPIVSGANVAIRLNKPTRSDRKKIMSEVTERTEA